MNAKLLLVALSCLLASALSEEIVPTFGVNKQIFYANGTLDFECTDTTVPTTFTPNATLYSDAGYTTPVGTYNVTFAHNDGSFTRTIRTINSTAVAGSISNFLAAALRNNGTGVFDKIAFITRFNTTGGVPVACTAASGIQSVVYSAVYGFYRSGAPTVSTPGATLKTSLRAVGTLNVDCSTGAVSGIESVMYTLADPPVPAGTYNGTFISSDGSFTRASSPTPFNATAGASLTYFLANGLLTNGTGALNGISFITRYDTVGGVCPSGTTSGTVNVPFEASYGFYAAATSSTSSTLSSTGTIRTTTSSASIFPFAGALIAVISMLMA